MSYLHCPVCSRAFNLARYPSCPACAVPAAPAGPVTDPVADLVAAAESLARALAQATPEQRAAAAARVQLPDVATPPVLAGTTALQPLPGARGLASPPAPRRSRWLAALAVTALDRLAARAPRRLVRAVHAGVKALAA